MPTEPAELTPEQRQQLDAALAPYPEPLRAAVASAAPNLVAEVEAQGQGQGQGPAEPGKVGAFPTAAAFQLLLRLIPMIVQAIQDSGLIKAPA
jgi:hypothetical protein